MLPCLVHIHIIVVLRVQMRLELSPYRKARDGVIFVPVLCKINLLAGTARNLAHLRVRIDTERRRRGWGMRGGGGRGEGAVHVRVGTREYLQNSVVQKYYVDLPGLDEQVHPHISRKY